MGKRIEMRRSELERERDRKEEETGSGGKNRREMDNARKIKP